MQITVLCVPGTMAPPAMFEPLAAALATPVEVAPWLEWPGPHGLDAVAERVATLAERHAPVVLVGHSTGGAIALLAARTPAVVGLVVSNSGANMRGHGDVDAFLERLRDDWGPPVWQALWQRSLHHPIDQCIEDAALAYPATLDPAAVLEVLRSQRDTDLTPLLGQIDVPVLVVHGKWDRARPRDHAEHLVAHLPDAELAVLDAGHSPMVEAPAEFAAAVSGLVARASRPDTRASVRG
ncbi:alpha/beta fold hydrolase [Solihabitans fulvus]|nr:alpha/beta hydrolase [Solihabitans fulvus]